MCPCLETSEFRERIPPPQDKNVLRGNYLFDVIILISVSQKLLCLECHISAAPKYLQAVYQFHAFTKSSSFSTDGLVQEKDISSCCEKQWKENESRSARTKHTICADQLSQ